jgi:hypothetical protein
VTPEVIISLASKGVRLQYLAMERSLRAVGCDLPVKVIPFNDDLFELPKGSTWWGDPKLQEWVKSSGAAPMMIKYQCLLLSKYAYFDSDICFVENPVNALEKTKINSSVIVSDTDWSKPEWTYTDESKKILQSKSSTWVKSVFNAGHFACDLVLYTHDEMFKVCNDYPETCIHCSYRHDQPGMNLLVALKDVPIVNLTLPPYNMESTWVGDYHDPDYRTLWNTENTPYFLHWAGPCYSWNRPPNEIFYEYLTREERLEWDEQQAIRAARTADAYFKTLPWWRGVVSRAKFRLASRHPKPPAS